MLLEENKLSSAGQPQTVVTSREFGAAIQQSDMVEVTMAADSKADITAALVAETTGIANA